MITEDYVSFETAKLLKEKGFNEICEMFYCKPHEGYLRNRKRNEWWNSDLREDMTCTCPTLQMALKWLREVHKLYVVVRHYVTQDGFFSLFDVKLVKEKGIVINLITKTGFTTYEEACEAGIKYCLENLI